MPTCDGCRFCCWSFRVNDMPDGSALLALTHCPHEAKENDDPFVCISNETLVKVKEHGCLIHNEKNYPWGCAAFNCPYLTGVPCHRPDTFQDLLERMQGSIGNYIPVIPRTVPVKKAERLIAESRSVLAAVVLNDAWTMVAMPLDRDSLGNWFPTDELLAPWKELCGEYGFNLEGRDSLDEKRTVETTVGVSNGDQTE